MWIDDLILDLKNGFYSEFNKKIYKVILPMNCYVRFYKEILDKSPLHCKSLPSPNEGFAYHGILIDFGSDNKMVVEFIN